MLRKIKKFFYKLKNQKGFTLIELIILIVILGIAVVPLTHLVTSNQKAIGQMALYVQAEFFTQSVMEEVIADYKSNARGYAWVLNNWHGASRSHPDLSIHANVSIIPGQDLQTGIHFADAVVRVNPGSGFNRIRLTCRLVDDGS